MLSDPLDPMVPDTKIRVQPTPGSHLRRRRELELRAAVGLFSGSILLLGRMISSSELSG
jgi:hypothetical protein